MHISSCEHPALIVNRYTLETIQSRCGKCATCSNSRAKDWINRLQLEARCHKYAFSIYLSYTNEFVPRLGLSDDLESLVWINRDADCIPLSEIEPYLHNDDYTWRRVDMEYLSARLRHPLGLTVPFIPDLQKFNKRFNKYCFKHVTGHYKNFRFFYVFEIGPTTHRPHVHGILFFDSDAIANRFSEILSSCWQYGHCDGDAIYSRGGFGYVAQYVNRPTHLPSFFDHPKLRQRHLFSRSPSIGTFNLQFEEIRRFFDRLPARLSIRSGSFNGFVDIPVFRSYKNRFFPKLKGHSDFSFDVRVSLYGVCEKVCGDEFADFFGFLKEIEGRCSSNCANSTEIEYNAYARLIRKDCKDSVSFIIALRRWWSLSCRVFEFRRLLGVSLECYVRRIDEYYAKCDYFNLKEFYDYESKYSLSHSPQELIHLYPSFIRTAFAFDDPYSHVPDYIDLACQSFGLFYWKDDDFDGLSDFKFLEECDDYKSMSLLHKRIYRDSHKRIESNAYIEGKKIDPSLKPILRKYHYSKIFKDD